MNADRRSSRRVAERHSESEKLAFTPRSSPVGSRRLHELPALARSCIIFRRPTNWPTDSVWISMPTLLRFSTPGGFPLGIGLRQTADKATARRSDNRARLRQREHKHAGSVARLQFRRDAQGRIGNERRPGRHGHVLLTAGGKCDRVAANGGIQDSFPKAPCLFCRRTL